MSLFGDNQYQWRETYFVLFLSEDRPSAEEVKAAMEQEDRVEISNVQADEEGRFESLTIKSPDDFSAMDIIYVVGDEVKEQVDELIRDMIKMTLTPDDRTKLDNLGDCDARFDVFHFEKMDPINEDEALDPGGLLIVLEKLAELSRGYGIDPQTSTFLP